MALICPKCTAQLDTNHIYCPTCGTLVDRDAKPVQIIEKKKNKPGTILIMVGAFGFVLWLIREALKLIRETRSTSTADVVETSGLSVFTIILIVSLAVLAVGIFSKIAMSKAHTKKVRRNAHDLGIATSPDTKGHSFCERCGADITVGAGFCVTCGNLLPDKQSM